MGDPLEGLNLDGTIRTGVNRNRVPGVYEPVLTTLHRAFEEVRSDSAELHLYGSVANGSARPGHSDVDLVAIDVPEEWCRRAGQELSARFSALVREVAIGCAHRADFSGEDDEPYGNRVFLRHYCVPLAGPDSLRPGEPFPGDARAARGFNGDIHLRLAQWRARRPTARALARKTLFAAAGVASVLTGTWTTALSAGAGFWAETEPGRAEEMARLHEWATGAPGPGAADLDAALAPGGVVASVVERFRAEVGLWA